MPHRPFLLTTLALATTTTLLAAPAATAATDPSPAPAAHAQGNEETPADKGGLRITAKDPEGTAVPGAAFQLLDAAGTKLADGATATDGALVLDGLAPGVVRLKETSAGSPILGTVPDQDVVIAPGAPKTLEITSPYKPAALTLKITDKTSGKGLPGAVVSIVPKGAKDTKGNFTLTTGKDGTAQAPLPVGKKTGSLYTATETKAPAGYRLETTPVEIIAKPAAPVTAALTHTTASTGKPTTDPTVKPTADTTAQPSPASSSSTAGATTSGTPAPDASASTSTGTATTASVDPAGGDEVDGSLAHTGADRSTWWLLGVGGLLLAAGAGAFYAVRRRKNTDSTGTGQHRRTH
ncbi:collagen binding domain-containing protein [Streptomyces noboritoensis]|uniref:Collagen binding domain-containing protein n=1 Tax=Streptomyces noboritoensis TaxID=67337 RepID=A0ABV6TFX7_9ACTN